MMKFNDQQLSDILKQVEVPTNLKDELRKIPQQEALTASPDSQVAVVLTRDAPKLRFARARSIGWLGLATSAALFFALIWNNQREGSMVSQKNRSTIDNDKIVMNTAEQLHTKEVEQLNRAIQVADLTLVQLHSEINEIESQLDAIKSNRSHVREGRLEVDEYTSLVIATASQSAILSGVSFEYLRSDLEESVQRFPDTRGSKIAAQLLASAAAQN